VKWQILPLSLTKNTSKVYVHHHKILEGINFRDSRGRAIKNVAGYLPEDAQLVMSELT
jgi:hypothetical protein